jgi:hypothetical protein
MRKVRGVAGHGAYGDAAVVRPGGILRLRDWLCVVIPALAGAGVSGAAAQEAQADSLLVATAEAILEAEERFGFVWPGYWPVGKAFILTDPGHTILLVSPVTPPPPFEPLSGGGEAEALTRRYFVFRGALPDLAASRGFFDLEYTLGEITAPAVSLRKDLASTLDFLFHEGFHGYQREHFPPMRRDDASVPDSIYLDTRYNESIAVEHDVLAEAILEADVERVSHLARTYLAVRHRRTSELPAHARLVENELEDIEGTATFVAAGMALLTLEGSMDKLASTLVERLREPLSEYLPPSWRHRARVYGTGAALGYVLDRLQAPWRAEVERGVHLEEILSRAVGFDVGRHGILADAVIPYRVVK